MLIGIDPSMTNTGLYCEPYSSQGVGGGSATIIKSSPVEGVIDQVSATISRCHKIMMDIDTWLIAKRVNEPMNFWVEGPAFADANHLLEMGIWYSTFHERFHGPPNTITIIAPASLKKYIGGKGNLKKVEVPLKVFKRWGIEFDHDSGQDMAHAYALWHMGLDIQHGIYALPEYNRRGQGRKARATANRKSRDSKTKV